MFGGPYGVGRNSVGIFYRVVVDWTENTVSVEDLVIKVVLSKSEKKVRSPVRREFLFSPVPDMLPRLRI